MGAPTSSRFDTIDRRAAGTSETHNTSEMHNASVNEAAAMAGDCAQVHLPTGRMCTLPHGHRGSCVFISAEAAARWLALRPMSANNARDQDARLPRAPSGHALQPSLA